MSIVVAIAVLVCSDVGHAETQPEPGAVALPADFAISLPFPAGVAVRVACAYGPGCSGYHVNTDTACCTNDYHALDLVRDQAGGGEGEPVTAIASGTVRYADWAGGGFASFGRYVVLEHDYVADGHAYFSIYAHLAAISVGVGEHVEMKQEIGMLGSSSNMLDDQFGAHVHIAVYQDASIDNGGAHGGHAVVPEPIDGYEDLVDGTVMVAGAGEPPPPDGGGTDTGDPTGGATSWGPGATGSTGDSWGGADGSGSTSTGAAASDAGAGADDGSTTSSMGALPPSVGGRGDPQGCGCTSTPARGWGAWLVLIAMPTRRRRFAKR